MLNGRRRFCCSHRSGWALPSPLSMLSPVATPSARHPAQRAIAVAISSCGTKPTYCLRPLSMPLRQTRARLGPVTLPHPAPQSQYGYPIRGSLKRIQGKQLTFAGDARRLLPTRCGGPSTPYRLVPTICLPVRPFAGKPCNRRASEAYEPELGGARLHLTCAGKQKARNALRASISDLCN